MRFVIFFNSRLDSLTCARLPIVTLMQGVLLPYIVKGVLTEVALAVPRAQDDRLAALNPGAGASHVCIWLDYERDGPVLMRSGQSIRVDKPITSSYIIDDKVECSYGSFTALSQRVKICVFVVIRLLLIEH